MNLKNVKVDISDPVQFLNNLAGQVELATDLSMVNYKLIMRTRLSSTIKFCLLAAFTYYVYDNLNRRLIMMGENEARTVEFENN